jgi:hypothetical protein
MGQAQALVGACWPHEAVRPRHPAGVSAAIAVIHVSCIRMPEFVDVDMDSQAKHPSLPDAEGSSAECDRCMSRPVAADVEGNFWSRSIVWRRGETRLGARREEVRSRIWAEGLWATSR